MAFAATLAREHVFERFLSDEIHHALMHGPTFMANPLACAAANASLDLFDSEPRLRQAQEMAPQLLEQLAPCRTLPSVVDVRSMGAVGVIQVDELRHLDQLRQLFVDAGVWVRPFGDAIYVTPSLNMEAADLEILCDAIVKVVHNWSRL